MRPGHTTAPGTDPLAALLRGYKPYPGVADELLDENGEIRRVWRPFLNHLARIAPEKLVGRFARGDQYLRDAGVFYRLYAESGSTERDWPLSHVPVVVHEDEWTGICEGLAQRAELLEKVLADLYGPGRLVEEGHLPARLVAQNPEWLRPLVGVTPRGGHFLHFIAFEIGRNPDGTWFVLSDRTQAPSGAGFALENRVATSRVFPDFYAGANIPRLASFFRAFRETLNGLRGQDNTRVGILTPGPMNDTYFEHTYIARYLGFMLLEGEDIVVQDGGVMVRTVAGLKPVDVLWRRLDARFADPLELDGSSRIGTPGLVAAVRSGKLSMVNALGSGIVETRAFLAFLPRIAQVLNGERLRMPNIATWWCGQPAERAFVKAQVERMMIGPALSNRLPFETGDTTALGGRWKELGYASPEAWIDAEGPALVGQEAVTLSTTPAYVEGRLRPMPMCLRVFLVRTAQGWQAMPGGYARIGRTEDATAIALQRGGRVADVWVLADHPVPVDTMVPPPGKFVRPEIAVLPSRAADNLFWLGRYVERVETAVRLLRAYYLREAESGGTDHPLVSALGGFLHRNGFDMDLPFADGLLDRIEAARNCAGKVRDRFSTDGWMALGDMADMASEMRRMDLSSDEAARELGLFLRRIASFSGLVHENMYRFNGWRFLSLGRDLERTDFMAWMLATFADPKAPDGALDLAVEVGDSLMTHRRRYTVSTNRDTVIDLLALDDRNPRSIYYQLGDLRTQIGKLPGMENTWPMPKLARRILEMHTGLAVLSPEEVTTRRLEALRAATNDLSDLIASTYFG